MTCCNRCIHCIGVPATWYDPPESWCELKRDEFEMEDSEYEAELLEKYGEDWEDVERCECRSYMDDKELDWLRAESRCVD